MITLTLPFPPSVNTYYRRGKYATYLSKKGVAFKRSVAEMIADMPKKKNRIEGRLSAFLGISAPDKRLRDIDNYVKPVFDALQDAGVFDNDEQVDFFAVARMEPVKGGQVKVILIGEKA